MKKLLITLTSLLLVFVLGIRPIANAEASKAKVFTVKFIDENNVKDITLSSGRHALATSLLIDTQEVGEGECAKMPSEDKMAKVTKEEYNFIGWSKDKKTVFDLNTPITGNTNLYSLYERKPIGQGSKDDYIEVELSFKEVKSSEVELINITGVLNIKVVENTVDLTTAGINILRRNSSNVKEFLNYVINDNASIKSATFDFIDREITVVVTLNNVDTTKKIAVNDVTLSLKDSNSNYENKAIKYESTYEFDPYNIVLAGSSSIENFKTSTEDLAPLTTLNCGIGGTTVDQWVEKFAKRLIYQYNPRAVVIYCGINNIINAKNTGEYTGNKLIELFNQIHETLPDCHIYYIPMNLVPGYMQYKAQIEEGNRIAIEYGVGKDYISYIDAGKLLLKENGEPNVAYFLSDGLHMSLCGYVIWGNEIKRVVIEKEKEIYNG